MAALVRDELGSFSSEAKVLSKEVKVYTHGAGSKKKAICSDFYKAGVSEDLRLQKLDQSVLETHFLLLFFFLRKLGVCG